MYTEPYWQLKVEILLNTERYVWGMPEPVANTTVAGWPSLAASALGRLGWVYPGQGKQQSGV